MNSRILLFYLSVNFILAGCTAPPENLSNEELTNISSIEQLIDQVIGFREANIEYRPYLVFPSDGDILKPAMYLRNYCSYIAGTMHQTQLDMPRLEQTNIEFGKDAVGYAFDDIIASFGRFKCQNTNNGFIVDITHGRASYVDGSARVTKVVINLVTKNQLKAEKLTRERANKWNRERANKLREEKQAQLKIAQKKFKNGQKTALIVGQKICSIQNQMGYVENISTNKIKILLLGKAYNEHDFALFSNKKISMQNAQRAYIWDDSMKWSKCNFRNF